MTGQNSLVETLPLQRTAQQRKYALDTDAVNRWLVEQTVPAFRMKQIEHALWTPTCASWDDISTLPRSMCTAAAKAFAWYAAESVSERVDDRGQTVTMVMRFSDGQTVETVVMHHKPKGDEHARTTVCISSQVGCAVGCPFCATGRLGLLRQCTVPEVLDQVRQAARVAAAHHFGPITHVVFMGMGEPLANEATTRAVITGLATRMGLSARRITLSTSGIAPAMDRLPTLGHPVTLALSLHAATDELRNLLVPINATYPIDRICRSAAKYAEATGRRVTYEWCLIEGINDTQEQANALRELAHIYKAHVNIIPMNRIEGSEWNGPSAAGVREFAAMVHGVRVTVRDTKAQGSQGACGQLRSTYEARRKQLPSGKLTPPVKKAT